MHIDLMKIGFSWIDEFGHTWGLNTFARIKYFFKFRFDLLEFSFLVFLIAAVRIIRLLGLEIDSAVGIIASFP